MKENGTRGETGKRVKVCESLSPLYCDFLLASFANSPRRRWLVCRHPKLAPSAHLRWHSAPLPPKPLLHPSSTPLPLELLYPIKNNPKLTLLPYRPSNKSSPANAGNAAASANPASPRHPANAPAAAPTTVSYTTRGAMRLLYVFRIPHSLSSVPYSVFRILHSGFRVNGISK